jgi:hypothetical protein
MSKKCAICGVEDPEYTWQPWGPDESPLYFVLAGNHTRGFPAIAVCQFCKDEKILAGEAIRFDYKHVPYRFQKEYQTPEGLVLWDGGTTTLSPHDETVHMLCRDTPSGHDIVGYITDQRLINGIIDAYNIANRK